VKYDDINNCFEVIKENGTVRKFHQSQHGLYYLDTSQDDGKNELGEVTLINTVENNMSKLSHRDYLRAVKACKLMRAIGHPSLQQFLAILDNNQLPNCPITRCDAMNAENTFGPDVGSLKGKTVHRPPVPVMPVLNDLPHDIMSTYRDITLSADIMYVNKIPFFVTISRHVHFSTVEMLYNRTAETMTKAMKQVFDVYKQRGFRVTHALMDNEFECLRGSLSDLQVTLNIVTKDEHGPEVERFI
jgi:hypothetical protein